MLMKKLCFKMFIVTEWITNVFESESNFHEETFFKMRIRREWVTAVFRNDFNFAEEEPLLPTATFLLPNDSKNPWMWAI